MSNVYLARFEDTAAFSTARKLVNYVRDHFPEGIVTLGTDFRTEYRIDSLTIKRLITEINTERFITIELSGMDYVHIGKFRVY